MTSSLKCFRLFNFWCFNSVVDIGSNFNRRVEFVRAEPAGTIRLFGNGTLRIDCHTCRLGGQCRKLGFLFSDHPFLTRRILLLCWRHLHEWLVRSSCQSSGASLIGGAAICWCCQGLLRWLLICTLVLIRVLTGGLLDVLIFFSKHARIGLRSRLREVFWEALKFFYLFFCGLRRVLDSYRYFSPHHRFFLILFVLRLLVFLGLAGPLFSCWLEYLLGFLLSRTCLYLLIWFSRRGRNRIAIASFLFLVVFYHYNFFQYINLKVNKFKFITKL